MEFLKVAEQILAPFTNEIEYAIPLRPLCLLIMQYVTTLDLEFEKQVLQASWSRTADHFVFVKELWTNLQASNHPVLSCYRVQLQQYLVQFAARSAMDILASILLYADGSVCNRFQCYYRNKPRECRCGSRFRITEMEFLKVAQQILAAFANEIAYAIPVKPLCLLVTEYVMRLDFEFEKQVLQASWRANTERIFVITLWNNLQSSDHPVLSCYRLELQQYLTQFAAERAMDIFASVLLNAGGSVCNRFQCYYRSGRPHCCCGSPVF